LVLELDEHKMQCASKRLAHKGEKFILVEKRQKDPNDEDYDSSVPYYYAPLIDDCASLYPDIQVLYGLYYILLSRDSLRHAQNPLHMFPRKLTFP